MTDRTVTVDGVRLTPGSRVRLRPSQRADIFDMALTGLVAEVYSIEEDLDGQFHVVVTLPTDAGRDFPTSLGHRFFFSPEEVEPLSDADRQGPRILIAGIGNIFLADDAFGPEVITAMRGRPVPDGVHVADFGIRGMDLAYRLLDGYDVALFVDAAPRGAEPGTVYVIEPDLADDDLHQAPEAHGMDPVKVLALARRLSQEDGQERLPRVLVLGCEPLVRLHGDEPEVTAGLSVPVRAAVGEAVRLLDSLTAALLRDPAGDPLAPAHNAHVSQACYDIQSARR